MVLDWFVSSNIIHYIIIETEVSKSKSIEGAEATSYFEPNPNFLYVSYSFEMI